MASRTKESPDELDPDISVEDLLKTISKTVRRAYLKYDRHPNQHDMEDAVHSIVFSLLKNNCHALRSFEHRSSKETWLQKVANHYVCRILRRQKDMVNVEELSPDDLAYQQVQEMEVGFKEMRVLLGEILGEFTRRERELLELLLLDLHTSEISKRMGIKPDSISKSKLRLSNKIRKVLNSRGVK
jgi:RNA polymerase sigma factor (sigma-70 family)